MQVYDDQNRLILAVNEDGKIAISRFVDMKDCYKNYIIDLYSNLTGVDKNKVEKFLGFKEGQSILCS